MFPISLTLQSQTVQAHIWIGLAVFCGFIMFDTQLIINKARNGDRDFIAHSLDLFIDFVQVFRKVLILLMQKVKYLLQLHVSRKITKYVF